MRLDFVKGQKLGLYISDSSNRVIVTRIDPNTTAEGKLMLCDQIIDVNGKPVHNKRLARELIIAAMEVK